jgi:DNA (cytosine-5)-methyltransferase 1
MGLIIDNFAGGGGASTGIEAALGRAVDIAINHDEQAIRMHEANHPGTLHIRNNIWQVDPLEATGGKPVNLAWFSPDCKHFSKAKGGKPREKSIRDLLAERDAMSNALHDAIHRPAGVVPASAQPFYQQTKGSTT